jgi:hypothetical protein
MPRGLWNSHACLTLWVSHARGSRAQNLQLQKVQSTARTRSGARSHVARLSIMRNGSTRLRGALRACVGMKSSRWACRSGARCKARKRCGGTMPHLFSVPPAPAKPAHHTEADGEEREGGGFRHRLCEKTRFWVGMAIVVGPDDLASVVDAEDQGPEGSPNVDGGEVAADRDWCWSTGGADSIRPRREPVNAPLTHKPPMSRSTGNDASQIKCSCGRRPKPRRGRCSETRNWPCDCRLIFPGHLSLFLRRSTSLRETSPASISASMQSCERLRPARSMQSLSALLSSP